MEFRSGNCKLKVLLPRKIVTGLQMKFSVVIPNIVLSNVSREIG
jgi:hypothetical protein